MKTLRSKVAAFAAMASLFVLGGCSAFGIPNANYAENAAYIDSTVSQPAALAIVDGANMLEDKLLPYKDFIDAAGEIEITEFDYGSIYKNEKLDIYKSYIAAAKIGALQNPDLWETVWLSDTTWVGDQYLYKIIEMAALDDPITSIYHTNDGTRIQIYTNDDNAFIASSPITDNTTGFDTMIAEVESRAQEIIDVADAYAEPFADQYGPESSEYLKAWVNAVFHQVVANADYDRRDKSYRSFHVNDIYGTLIEGLAQCGGYSSAFKYILDAKGIPNFIATGNADGIESNRHAFNVLLLNGEWLVLDGTMSAYYPFDSYSGPRTLVPGSTNFGNYYEGSMVPISDFVIDRKIELDNETDRLRKSLGIKLPHWK